MGFGEYPAEYNVRIHGPYDPARYYGKPDPLSTTKLGDLGSWLSRRSKSPQAMAQALSRSYWRYLQKWVLVKKGNFAPFGQFIAVMSFSYYFFQYHGHRAHRHTKYH